MKVKQLWLAASCGLCLCATVLASENHHAAHWGYEGDTGPAHWASLNEDYALCGLGQNQSPVNLSGFVEADLPALDMRYGTPGKEVVNNGHTIQVNMAAGSVLRVDGQDFALKQFHFHAPSENQLNGQSFPMEAHLVHAAADGHLAVVAVFFKKGQANPAVEKVWPNMPTKPGKQTLAKTVDVNELLPASRDYFRFNGSLTTPPCSEGVRWFVMKQPVEASPVQIEQFRKVMHHANNRPVQPLNARVILQ